MLRRMNIPAFPDITRGALHTLQANLGYRCNQACSHCHVEAGPNRTEVMGDAVVDALMAAFPTPGVTTLDLTGGAPELHPRFRELVLAARAAGLKVIDRCNLTILCEPGQADLAAFLAANGVTVVASLPCYLNENVDRQRGQGVFARSLDGLKKLNACGYGGADSGLELNLVYNPQGPDLPPPAEDLEVAYREHLAQAYGIVFTRLITITNMPIKRFAHALKRDGTYADYLALLAREHVPQNLAAVMCRGLVSIDWRGRLYDCDFNQMLGLPLGGDAKATLEALDLTTLMHAEIATAAHCFGCTAGRGSSCSGALRQYPLADGSGE